MKIKKITKYSAMGMVAVSALPLTNCSKVPDGLLNILWIVSEDNSTYFTHCYGNGFATTSNIDKLASEGFLYTHAYCPNAVCLPSRNTIITGAYSTSNGSEQMCSNYPMSDEVHTYAEYLRQAGYYCTNNSKTGSVLI